jgi:hypothetical protein
VRLLHNVPWHHLYPTDPILHEGAFIPPASQARCGPQVAGGEGRGYKSERYVSL